MGFDESHGVAVVVVITVLIATPAVVLTSVGCPLDPFEAKAEAVFGLSFVDGVTPGVIIVVLVVVSVVLSEIGETTLSVRPKVFDAGRGVIELERVTVFSVVAETEAGSLDG